MQPDKQGDWFDRFAESLLRNIEADHEAYRREQEQYKVNLNYLDIICPIPDFPEVRKSYAAQEIAELEAIWSLPAYEKEDG